MAKIRRKLREKKTKGTLTVERERVSGGQVIHEHGGFCCFFLFVFFLFIEDWLCWFVGIYIDINT